MPDYHDLFQRRNFEFRQKRNIRNDDGEGPMHIQADLMLQNLTDFMRGQEMIDRSSLIKGLNVDYRPTSKYCHRAVLSVLF